MAKKTYYEKLKDPRWQKKRLEILQRDDFKCQMCESTTETLHVHHRYYKGFNPWDTPSDGLTTLCHSCHECEERDKKEYEPLFFETFYKAGFFAGDILGLASSFHDHEIKRDKDLLYAMQWITINEEIKEAVLKHMYENQRF